MSSMADPMIALLGFQQALNNGAAVDPHDLDDGYLTMYDDRPDGGKRYSYAKIINGEVQALAIFGLEDPINSVDCYNIGYAVNEGRRGQGLAVEAVKKGIEDLKKRFRQASIKSFYVEAVIDVTNAYSIKVAEKLFSDFGVATRDAYSGTPSLYFKKLIVL